MNKINQIAQEHKDYTVNYRRDFHQNPELGFKEFRTSEIIANELKSLGFEVQTNVGKTGVVGLINGNKSGTTLLLRFDMDALPIKEENSTSYISKNKGVMHACGHDGHMSIGLAVAKILSEYRDKINGSIKFIFQPAEEGLGGALATIEDGILENPKPDFCLGLHLWNEKPIGWVGSNTNSMMAGADTFEIKVKGKGGHGAHPDTTIDPIVAAAQIVTASQTIVSRNVSPFDTSVLSFCSINGGTAFNVIPQEVVLKGTIRTFNADLRSKIINRFEEIVKSTGSAMGCDVGFQIDEITPAVINDPQLVSKLVEVVGEQYPEFDMDTKYQTMGSEDFSLFLNRVPGCFFFVGSADPERNLNYGHHHPKFDFDEEVLPISASLMLGIIQKLGCINF